MIGPFIKTLPSRIGVISQFHRYNKFPTVANVGYNFSKQYKVITDPKDVSKLIFDEQGKCKIFEHKNG